tara:strand:- start:346 stop:831 length:486 start_codon:yes stop_codon:yes gene_type:complete
MGWWSTDILGGDSALDWKSALYNKIDVQYENNFGYRTLKPNDMSSKTQNNLIQYVLDSTQKSFDDWGECDSRSIGMQIIALMIIESGAKITNKNKKELIKWIKKDEWAEENDERKDNINDLLSAIKKYDSTPMIYQGEGLFQKLAERIYGTEIQPSGFKNI